MPQSNYAAILAFSASALASQASSHSFAGVFTSLLARDLVTLVLNI